MGFQPDALAAGDDDLSRQRRKREARLLARPVAGFPELTLRQVVAAVLEAGEASRQSHQVERFLTEQGHSWETIEMVLAYLGPGCQDGSSSPGADDRSHP